MGLGERTLLTRYPSKAVISMNLVDRNEVWEKTRSSDRLAIQSPTFYAIVTSQSFQRLDSIGDHPPLNFTSLQ